MILICSNCSVDNFETLVHKKRHKLLTVVDTETSSSSDGLYTMVCSVCLVS